MALLGRAAIAMWWDISAERKAEFEDWHSHEHFPERLAHCRASSAARAGRAADGGPGFFVLYELDELRDADVAAIPRATQPARRHGRPS